MKILILILFLTGSLFAFAVPLDYIEPTNAQFQEADGDTVITVVLSSDTWSSSAKISYEITAITTTLDTDVTTTSSWTGDLLFPNTDRSSIPLTIINDGIVEEDETFQLRLYDPSGITLGDDTITIFTIIDDDTAPAITSDSTTVAEGGSVIFTPIITDPN